MNNQVTLSVSIQLGAVKKVKHYKTDWPYNIIALAYHSESSDILVVYSHGEGELTWARPLKMFDDIVQVNGVDVPRFVEVA